MRSGLLVILRAVLVCHTFWISKSNRYHLSQMETLVESFKSRDISIAQSDLVRDIRARLLYLEHTTLA